MIGSQLKRYQPDWRYMVPDKETEGLNLWASRPWQIAWIIADSKQVYEREEHYIWFKDLYVSPQAALITRFDYAKYKERAEDPVKVLDRYEERLYDTSMGVVGQNFFYDGDIHKTWRRVCGRKHDYSWTSRLYDTNCLSKAYRKGIKPDLTNFLAWQYKMQSIREKLKTRLETMCGEFKIPFDPYRAHEALYDVEKTRELFEKQKWAIEF